MWHRPQKSAPTAPTTQADPQQAGLEPERIKMSNIFDRNFVKTRVKQEMRGGNPATQCPFCGNIARIKVIDNRRDTVHLCCIVCAKKFIELHGEGCGQLLADEIQSLIIKAKG